MATIPSCVVKGKAGPYFLFGAKTKLRPLTTDGSADGLWVGVVRTDTYHRILSILTAPHTKQATALCLAMIVATAGRWRLALTGIWGG